jgi:mono/diheme cytochrome c family protein
MKSVLKTIAFAAAALAAQLSLADDPAQVARGRYIVNIAGCQDCHTPGYAESAGHVPASRILTGLPVGFNGPWGTSYPSNLRLLAQQVESAEQWLAVARAPRRSPMPWFSLRDMSDQDVMAIYAYLRSLGPAGEPAPAAVPPGETPTTPFIVFVPQEPVRAAGNKIAAR